MNKLFLTGHIGRIETKTLTNGVVNNISIAVDKSRKTDQGWINETEWFQVQLFKETKLQKGDLIAMEGGISNRKYEKDGVTHYVTDITAFRMELLHRKTTTDTPPVGNEPIGPGDNGDLNLPF